MNSHLEIYCVDYMDHWETPLNDKVIPMVACLKIRACIARAEVVMVIICENFQTFVSYAPDIFIIHSRLPVLRKKVKNLLQLIRNLHPPLLLSLLVQVSVSSAR